MASELPPRRTVGREALAALAVPARYAILAHLTAGGPATASRCAEVVGESASNCSWHLRTLAKAGLVEPAEPQAADRRARWWQASSVGFAFGGSAGDAARQAVEATAAEHADDLYRRHLAARTELTADWQDASGENQYAILASPEELVSLTAAIDALVRPMLRPLREDAPAAARLVHVGLRAFPA